MLLVPAIFAGPLYMVALIAPIAGLAAIQASASWRGRDPRPIDGVAGLGAGAVVVGSAFGLAGVAITLVGIAAAAVGFERVVAARRVAGRVKTRRSAWRTALVGLGPAVAGAAPVVVRSVSAHGALVCLALCTYALVYDASSFLVGSGARRRWEGPVAGMASIAVVTVAVAAILVPPFRGTSPWVLGGVAAAATPVGPVLATALLGDRRAPVPALRRLDSLLVLGPVYAALALLVVG
jgi:hypothetical protein